MKNPERIREVLSDANDQFKNGNRYKSAPSLLAIFHEGLDVPDETIIASALYGNLKFSYPEGQPEKGEYIVDKDGGWTPEKNTTTSAVHYARNNGEPLLVHNYWAQRPFPEDVFSCKEISLSPNGLFEETDFANITAPRPVLSRIVDIPGRLLCFLRRIFRR
ncbi:hypothetical protein [Bradyrhizobium sp. RT9a]|uniref:hypothetical protein n=1 Tax=Bradyrhizobium sp. RT9a TaxID=3156384 RepID=UPI0033977555